MKDPIDLLLFNMVQDPAFQALVDRLEQERPLIPEFSPSQDNTERWKQASGRRQGYDLCLGIFGLKIGEIK